MMWSNTAETITCADAVANFKALSLRGYQRRALTALSQLVGDGARSVLMVSPTGSGKTVMFCQYVRDCGKKAIVVVHRVELVAQARARLAGLAEVSTIQGMLASDTWPNANLLILDEAHHYVAEQWKAVCAKYSNAVTVGWTATPARGDGVGLGDVFERLVVCATYPELVSSGDISRCEVLAPVGYSGKKLAGDPLSFVGPEPTLIFAECVDAAKEYAERIGPKARAVYSGLDPDTREDNLRAFASGECDVLCNCMILTEGWDCPRAKRAILARRCGSVGVYLQIAGRILRPPGDATLVDLGGSFDQYGHPTNDREYSLTGEGILSRGERSLWQCALCGMVRELPPSKRLCPRCGHLMHQRPRIGFVSAKMERKMAWECTCGHQHYHMPMSCALCGKPSPRYHQVSAETPQQREEYIRRMRAIAAQRGYKQGWVWWKVKTKYGDVGRKNG